MHLRAVEVGVGQNYEATTRRVTADITGAARASLILSTVIYPRR